MKTLDGKPYYYPATLSKSFADPDDTEQDILQLALGEDLVVHVCHRDKDSDYNPSVRIEVYDCDFNYIATMGMFCNEADALAVPAMIPVIQGLYPSHIFGAEEADAA